MGVEEENKGIKGSSCMKLEFQVADVKKPLIAVKRIAEKGNHISFGPGTGDNYIENRESGYRIPMRESGSGSYLMDVEFSNGSRTSL